MVRSAGLCPITIMLYPCRCTPDFIKSIVAGFDEPADIPGGLKFNGQKVRGSYLTTASNGKQLSEQAHQPLSLLTALQIGLVLL